MSNNLIDNEYIYEPLLAYDKVLRQRHDENTKNYFENLKQKSQVNVEENKQTNLELETIDKKLKSLESEVKKQNIYKALITFLMLGFLVTAFISLYQIFNDGFSVVKLLLIIFPIIFFVLLLILILKKINPAIKNLETKMFELKKQYEEKLQLAWSQMASLNKLFTYGMSAEIFKKTLPLIKLDKMFDSKRLDYMVNKFGLNDVPDLERSALYVQSGDINGNPFYLAKDLVHKMGEKTYTGTLVITWTTTTRDSNGRIVTRTHTQTLVAHVRKPCPFYREDQYLVYANEAAPDLIFSRLDSDAENMDDKQIDKHVKKEKKKIDKKAKVDLKQGKQYTAMGNTEFEVLFGASNRNNEVQFRLLFTVLAQKQLLQLMKEKTIGFGDNFNFIKHKMINIIEPEHLKGVDLNVSPSFFQHYNFEVIKNRFISYNNNYFKYIYFAFSPILSIPLYQHQKPHEYIYKDFYDSYVSFYEHEQVVNMMNENEFKHPLSKTRNILKTSVVKSGNNLDKIKVTAYGYDTIERIDFVPTLGGDGRIHQVPVRWDEYIPVSQNSEVDINVMVDKTKPTTYNEKIRKIIEEFKDNQVVTDDMVKIGLLVAYVTKKGKNVI